MPKRTPRIVLIDKNTALAEAYKDRLALEGLDCLVFERADEAFSYIMRLPCDLMIVDDYNIADVNSEDFFDLVSAEPALSVMPIVVLSSNPNYEHREDVSEYLPKSGYSAATVISKVKSLI